MSKRPKITLKRAAIAVSLTILGIPLLLLLIYGALLLSRPPRTETQQQLFQGILYRRFARSTPRPNTIHIVTIDLTAPGIGVLVTPGKPNGWDKQTGQPYELRAQTTSDFVKEFKLQLAINGSFFGPFRENGPLDYYPHNGEPVSVFGQVISNGNSYSSSQSDSTVLCFAPDNRVQIRRESCEKSAVQALSGGDVFVDGGKPVVLKDNPTKNDLYPRTAVAIDKSGEKLWLIIVDGRQAKYSEGMTLPELTDIVMELGAYKALNLDGGGSTTLVVADSGGTRSLNSPIHTRIPMRQRPIANHLGFYARRQD